MALKVIFSIVRQKVTAFSQRNWQYKGQIKRIDKK